MCRAYKTSAKRRLEESQCNPKHIDSEVRPAALNGVYSMLKGVYDGIFKSLYIDMSGGKSFPN